MANELTFSADLANSLDTVAEALPVGLNKVRFVQECVSLMNDNKQLQDFARQYGTAQIKLGLLKAAYLNLSFTSGQCYLIPYKNVLNFRVDYKGDCILAKKYSIRPIKEIYAKLVREGDSYEEAVVNGEQTVNFKPLPFNNGKIIGCFAVCQYEDGGLLIDSASIEEINVSRKKAQSQNVWNEFTGEMVKKTILHRLCKRIELNFESIEQRNAFDEDTKIETDPVKAMQNRVSEEQATVDFVDAEAVEVNA